MVGETTKDRHPLLPDRMQQGDFFLCDIFDAAPKGDIASMEHPIFSLSTRPDKRLRRYENGRNFVEIQPSGAGLATVHDRDVLIFCISQIMAALNEGRKVSQKLRFRAYDLLAATNRPKGGESYARLRDALDRLAGTRIVTNITTGDQEVTRGFGLIDSYEIVRETREGRMQEIEIELSDWVFRAIQHHEVLTLNRNYFRLRKPLERRLYELARKHCGNQAEWRIGLEKLQAKCGSSSGEKEFRRMLREIIAQDEEHAHIPDYTLRLNDEDVVVISNRAFAQVLISDVPYPEIKLDWEAYHDAKLAAPGWDVQMLETEWRNRMAELEVDPPSNPARAFGNFCRKWFETRGPAT